VAPADPQTTATGDQPAARDAEALLDELVRLRALRRRVRRWLRLIGLLILVAYAVAIAVIAASFAPRELSQGFELTADALTGTVTEELPEEIAAVAPVLIDAAREGVLEAWPKVLVQAEKRFSRIERRSLRATSERFTAASRDLAPGLEQELATRFPALDERPEARAAIAGALHKALTKTTARRSRERLIQGRETVIASFAALARIAETELEPQEFKQRMTSVLRYLATGPTDPDAGPQPDADAAGEEARR
jgi:hypothetical protein